MKIILITFFLLKFCFYTSISFGQDEISCKQMISNRILMKERRERREALPYRQFEYNNEEYSAIGFLGKSSNFVYLAENNSGHRVVVKTPKFYRGYPDAKIWPQYTFPYEYWHSKYIKEKFPELYIAEVYKYIISPIDAYIVKEYIHGFTDIEIKFSLSMTKELITELMNELLVIENLFKDAHKGFKKWMRDKEIDNFDYTTLDTFPEYEKDMYKYGDFHSGNFIYSIKLQRWVLIDP